MTSSLINSSTILWIGILAISYIIAFYIPVILMNRSSNLPKLKQRFLIASIPCALYLTLAVINIRIDFPFPNFITYIFTLPETNSEPALNAHSNYDRIDFLLKGFRVQSVMNILGIPIFGWLRLSYEIHKNGAHKMTLINEGK